jgi:sugar phosphate isomerase/epimerase
MNRESLNRREFLQRAGAGSVALFGVAGITMYESPEQLSRIGVQLYTVRNQMRDSVEKTLEQVARIGYKEVEFAGYFGRTPQQIRSILDANGLTSPSAHSAAMPAIRTRLSQLIDEAAIIGQKYLICASIPRSEMTADGFKKVAGELNHAGETAAKHGIKFGFHNHSDDLAPLGSTTGFDILLTECDPKVTSMQMDIYWLVRGGKDPLAYIDKYPGRFYSVHVKDMAVNGAMVDAGSGTLPFGKIFALSKRAGLQHYFVEHDDPADPMASIAASYRNISALKY